jgi:hypothetical protein
MEDLKHFAYDLTLLQDEVADRYYKQVDLPADEAEKAGEEFDRKTAGTKFWKVVRSALSKRNAEKYNFPEHNVEKIRLHVMNQRHYFNKKARGNVEQTDANPITNERLTNNERLCQLKIALKTLHKEIQREEKSILRKKLAMEMMMKKIETLNGEDADNQGSAEGENDCDDDRRGDSIDESVESSSPSNDVSGESLLSDDDGGDPFPMEDDLDCRSSSDDEESVKSFLPNNPLSATKVCRFVSCVQILQIPC